MDPIPRVLEPEAVPDADGESEREPTATQLALFEAMVETSMEADRTLVALSAGGVALLVGLLSTVAPTRGGPFHLYWLALMAFLLAMATGVAIFRLNASMLGDAMVSLKGALHGTKRKWLRALDYILIAFFAVGVLLSVCVGVTTAQGGAVVQQSTLEAS
jgi:hypothetical protein